MPSVGIAGCIGNQRQAPNQHDMHMLRMGNAHGRRKQRGNKSVQVARSARHGSRHHDMKHVRKRRLGLDASRNEEVNLNRRPDATMTAVGKAMNIIFADGGAMH